MTASTAVMAGIVRAAKGASEIAAGVLSPAASSLNGPISDLRRYSAAKVPLATSNRCAGNSTSPSMMLRLPRLRKATATSHPAG